MSETCTLPAVRGPQALSRQTFRVLGQNHPFQVAWSEQLVPVGASILESLEAVGLEPSPSTSIWLNGHWVPIEHWKHVRPKANCLIRYRVFPRGGMVRSILLIAVAVIASVASYFFPPAMGLAAGSWGAAFAGAGIGAAVSAGGCVQVCGIVPRRRVI